MSSNLANEMGANLVERTKTIGFALLALPVLSFWGDYLFSLIQDSNSKSVPPILSVGFSSLVWANLVLVLLARNLAIHRKLDRITFRLLSKVEQRIQTGLHDRLKAKSEADAAILAKDKSMDIFYHFVNQQEVLRTTAFYYWEGYYALLYVLFYAVISSLLIIAAALLSHTAYVSLVFITLILVVIVVLDIEFSLKGRILSLADTQLDEIFASQFAELCTQVRSRSQ